MRNKFQKSLRMIAKTFCIISVINGVSGIVISSIAKSYEDSLLIDEDLKSYKAFMPNLFYFLASVFIFTGILGIYAVYSKMIRPLIIAFKIINFILFIVFLIIFILFVNKYNFIQTQSEDASCETGILKEPNIIFQKAKQIWCKKDLLGNDACPCSIISMGNWSKDEQAKLSKEYDEIKPTGNNKLQQCTNIEKLIPNLSEYLQLLKQIENTYNCNGICDPGDLVYFFTNINQGPPQSKTCFESIFIRIIEWILVIMSYSAVSLFINLINIIIFYLNTSIRFNMYQNVTVGNIDIQSLRIQQGVENFTLNKLV